MRAITHVTVHCSATPQTTTIASMQSYWKNILGWKNAGYHYIVKPNGDIERLTPESIPSNGVKGHNATGIHVSYIGGIDKAGNAVDNRTPEQKASLLKLLRELVDRYPNVKILGHRDWSPDKNHDGKITVHEWLKSCPCFDAIPEYKHLTKA